MSDERVNTVSIKLEQALQFTATFDNFPGVAPLLLDEPPPLGSAAGPNASALLGAAVGNCLAASLLFCLRRARVEVAGLDGRVDVHVARAEKGRLRIEGIDVRLSPQLAPGTDPERAQRCRELFEDFCIVTASVRKGIPVQVSLTQGTEGVG